MELTTQEKLFAEMTPATQKIAKSQLEKRLKLGASAIRLDYELGRNLATAQAKQDTYGDSAVRQIAEYLQRPAEYLYRLINVVDVWTWPELEEELGVPMESGETLSMTHFVILASMVTTKRDRTRFLKQTRRENLSTKELKLAISSASAVMAKSNETRGRKPAKPDSPRVGMKQVHSSCQSLSKKLDATQDIMTFLETCPAEVFDDVVRVRLEEAVQAAEVASATLAVKLQQLSRIKYRTTLLEEGDDGELYFRDVDDSTWEGTSEADETEAGVVVAEVLDDDDDEELDDTQEAETEAEGDDFDPGFEDEFDDEDDFDELDDEAY